MVGPRASNNRSVLMKWETPEAIELRLGMEITLYIARR